MCRLKQCTFKISLSHNAARGDFNMKPCGISMHNDPDVVFPDRPFLRVLHLSDVCTMQ